MKTRHTKKRGIFGVFEKILKLKGKKNTTLSYPGIRYAHKKLNFACKKSFFGKCLLAYKIRFALEKKNKKMSGAISTFFVSP